MLSAEQVALCAEWPAASDALAAFFASLVVFSTLLVESFAMFVVEFLEAVFLL